MIHLEDEAGDVLKKARFGQEMSAADAAALSGVSEEELAAVEALTAPLTSSFRPLAERLDLRADALFAMADEEGVDATLPGHVARLSTPWGSFTYVVDTGAGAVVIDPAVPPAMVREALAGRPLLAVFLTHGHNDHVATVDVVKGEAPLFASPELAARFQGEAFGAGVRYGFHALFAPGHAAEGLAFAGHGVLVTGDALFARSAGGARRPQAYPEVIATVERLLAEDPALVVLPGHGGTSTIALERRLNPFLPASSPLATPS